jgi:hypothetical protein
MTVLQALIVLESATAAVAIAHFRQNTDPQGDTALDRDGSVPRPCFLHLL